jgi:hypothetical protein
LDGAWWTLADPPQHIPINADEVIGTAIPIREPHVGQFPVALHFFGHGLSHVA